MSKSGEGSELSSPMTFGHAVPEKALTSSSASSIASPGNEKVAGNNAPVMSLAGSQTHRHRHYGSVSWSSKMQRARHRLQTRDSGLKSLGDPSRHQRKIESAHTNP